MLIYCVAPCRTGECKAPYTRAIFPGQLFLARFHDSCLHTSASMSVFTRRQFFLSAAETRTRSELTAHIIRQISFAGVHRRQMKTVVCAVVHCANHKICAVLHCADRWQLSQAGMYKRSTSHWRRMQTGNFSWLYWFKSLVAYFEKSKLGGVKSNLDYVTLSEMIHSDDQFFLVNEKVSRKKLHMRRGFNTAVEI